MTTDACREWRGAHRRGSPGRDRTRRSDRPAGAPRRVCRLPGRAAKASRRSRARSRSRIPSRVRDAPGAPAGRLEAQVVDRVAFERARARRRTPSGCGCWRWPRSSPPHSGSAVRWSWPNATTRRRRRRSSFGPTSEASGGTAQLRAHDTGTEVDLVADGLDEGDWYWLWLTGDDGDRVRAGTFRGTGDTVQVDAHARRCRSTTRAASGSRRQRRQVVLDARHLGTTL